MDETDAKIPIPSSCVESAHSAPPMSTPPTTAKRTILGLAIDNKRARPLAERGVAVCSFSIQRGVFGVAGRVTHCCTAKPMSPSPAAILTHATQSGGASFEPITPANDAKIVVTTAMDTIHVDKYASADARGCGLNSNNTAGRIANGEAAIPRARATISPTAPRPSSPMGDEPSANDAFDFGHWTRWVDWTSSSFFNVRIPGLF